MRLLESPRPLANYEVFHFAGHWFERGVRLAEIVCRLGDIPLRQIKPFPWWALKLAAPLVEVFREMGEMRYLWEIPLRLDNAKLFAYIGEEPHTPIEAALMATLGHLLKTATAPDPAPPSAGAPRPKIGLRVTSSAAANRSGPFQTPTGC